MSRRAVVTLLCLVAVALGACRDEAPMEGVARSAASGGQAPEPTEPFTLPSLSLDAEAGSREAQDAGSPLLASSAPQLSAAGAIKVIVYASREDIDQELELVVLSTRSRGLPDHMRELASVMRWSWNTADRYGTRRTFAPEWRPIGEEAELADTAGMTCEAVLAAPTLRCRLFAKLGTSVSSGLTSKGSNGSVLVLDLRDPSERIQGATVFGWDGRPLAGVPVVATKASPKSEFAPTGIKPASAKRTDAEGKVELSLKEGERPAAAVWGRALILDDREAPGEIRMPEVGSVHLRWVYPDSMPQERRPSKVSIEVMDKPMGVRRQQVLHTRDLEFTLFPFTTNKTFVARVTAGACHGEATFDAPVGNGNRVDVTVPLAESRSMQFRLVDESGAGLSELDFVMRRETLRGKEVELRTDAAGSAFHVLHGLPTTTPIERLFVQEVVPPRDKRDGLFGILEIEAGRQLALDLGGIVMRPVPPLVEGRVVDEDGGAARRAYVTLLREKPSGIHDVPGGPKSELVAVARADFRGAFQVRVPGWTASEDVLDRSTPLFLNAATKKGRHTHSPHAFEPGDGPVTLTVRAPGSVTIDTAEVNSRRWGSLRLQLQHDLFPISENVPMNQDGSRESPKQHTFEELPPGSYTLYADPYESELKPLVRNILIYPGKDSPTVRVTDEDLVQRVSSIRFTVRLPSGESAGTIHVDKVMPDGSVTRATLQSQDDLFEMDVTLGELPECYWIEAVGCQRYRDAELGDGSRVRLRPNIEITVQLTGCAAPLGPLRLMAEPTNAAFYDEASVLLDFNSEGYAMASFGGLGTYTLNEYEGPGSSSSSEMEPWIGVSFNVTRAGSTVSISPRRD